MAVGVSAQKAAGHGREIPHLVSCQLRVQLLVRFQRADAKLPAQVVGNGVGVQRGIALHPLPDLAEQDNGLCRAVIPAFSPRQGESPIHPQLHGLLDPVDP